MTRTSALYALILAGLLSACGEHSEPADTSSPAHSTLAQALALQVPALGEPSSECSSDEVMTCQQLCFPKQPSPGPVDRCCNGDRYTTCEIEGYVTTGDRDGDGRVDTVDNCPGRPNPQQENQDGDDWGDVCDNCPDFASPDLSDRNNNGQGDVCEDWDGDGVLNSVDNCPDHFNPAQHDVDEDGQGAICDLNGDAPTHNADAMEIIAPTCSSDYSLIDDCINEMAPLPPSLDRGISRGDDYYLLASQSYSAYRLPIDDTLYTRPVSLNQTSLQLDTPLTDQTQVLPAERSTSDGRVLLMGDSLLVYRPEVMGRQQRIIQDSVSAISDRVHSYGVDIKPLFFGAAAVDDATKDDYKNVFNSSSGSTICERVQDNPRRCDVQEYGQTVAGDCYDITYMIPATPPGHTAQSLLSADMTLFVKDAKTPSHLQPVKGAHITQVGQKDRILRWRQDEGPGGVVLEGSNEFTQSAFPVIRAQNLVFTTDCTCAQASGCETHPYDSLTEMTTTADGTLLIANGTGLSYAIADDSQLGCQADQFTLFKPLSCFPSDPRASHYKLAQNTRTTQEGNKAFYDTQGEPIEPGSIVYGAYPWVDREGSNIFYTDVINFRDAWKARDQAPSPPSKFSHVSHYPDQSNSAKGNGVVALGAWTQGKVVVLDNLINATDWTGGMSDVGTPQGGANVFYNFEMPLYQTSSRWVRPAPVSLINSSENRFNYFESHSPTLPFDVVWSFATNHNQNSEVAFDEYMLNNAFVVAHMNAPHTRFHHEPWNPNQHFEVYSNYPDDGFEPVRTDANMANYVMGYGQDSQLPQFRFSRSPKLQNASTSWPDRSPFQGGGPKTLRVRGGARVEPVALGGVQGKGLYLDGDNDFIDMGFPTPHHDAWFYGIWLDSREANQSTMRTVFFWPDESWIALDRGSLHAYNARTRKTRRLILGDQGLMGTRFRTGERTFPGKYFHLGVKIHQVEGTQRIEVYINGTHAGRLDMNDGAGFDLNYYEGWSWFAVGDPGPGFVSQGHEARQSWRGWVDEFRIYALDEHHTDHFDEFICNLAMGSLMRREGEAFCEQLELNAKGHPVDIPQQNGLKCADKAHQLGADPSCLRTQKLGLVVTDPAQPRHDFQDNEFCLTCHLEPHAMTELDITHALLGIDPHNPVNPPAGTSFMLPSREHDPRRQPMDWPSLIHGTSPVPGTPPPVSGYNPPLMLDGYFHGLYSKL
jgi:hypothetical protein